MKDSLCISFDNFVFQNSQHEFDDYEYYRVD